MDMLVSKLSSEVDAKNKQLKEMENKYNEVKSSLSRALEEKECLHHTYVSATRALEEKEMLHHTYLGERTSMQWSLHGMFLDNQKLKTELDAVRKDLEFRTFHGSRANEQLKTELESVKKELESRTYHGSRANEKLKTELESVRKELEHQKNGLRNNVPQDGHEIEKTNVDVEKVKISSTMKGKSQVLKRIEADWENLLIDGSSDETDNDPEFLNTLIMKERMSNSELQEARKELLKGLEDLPSARAAIRIKRMGEINATPFYKACLKRYSHEEVDVKSVELISLWQDHIGNSNWHPFKITTINGKLQEIIDDDDDKMKSLRNEWGMEVYKAVAGTLLEMNEYNPSGRYTVPELWNFKEGKRASLKEVIQYLFEQMKSIKSPKRRKLAIGPSRA